MTINVTANRIQPRRLPALAVLTLWLLLFYGGALMAASKDTKTETAEDAAATQLSISDVENILGHLEQQLEQVKDTTAADLAISNIKNKLEQIEQQLKQQLEQMNLGLDEKGIGIADNIKSNKKLQQDLATLSSNVRTNTTELNAQKSLIEDNSVRLYDILIRISNAIDAMQALEDKVQQSEQPRVEVESALENLGRQLERLWTLLLLGLVFLPPLAFALINRGKQRQGVLLAFTGLSLGYLTLGFGLMYGVTHMGWIGSPVHWFGDINTALPTDKPWIAFMLYQTALVAFAGLVIHTTIKQHLSNLVQLLLALFVAILLIPIFGHWLWAGQLITDNNGFLQGMGLVDKSKITTLGLLAAWFTGVLLWRLPSETEQQETKRPAVDNKPICSGGTAFLFYLAWFGFSADVSTIDYPVANVALTMMLAASAASLSVFIQQLLLYPNQDHNPVAYTPGGFISGLVAIAACVQSVTLVEALVIGAIAGLLYRFAFGPLSRVWRRRTGPSASTELIVIHLVASIWGLVCVGLFSTKGDFAFPDMAQLTDQLQVIGIALIYGYVMAMLAAALFTWRKKKTASPAESGN